MKGMSNERRGEVGTQQGIADQAAAVLRSSSGGGERGKKLFKIIVKAGGL